MSKKKNTGKKPEGGLNLTPEESAELQMILDRLSVQAPEGESFERYLRSLRETLVGREKLIGVLIEGLSRNPSTVGFRVFSTLRELVQNKEYRRAVKQAAYRFSQRGYSEESEASSVEKIVLIPKETKKALAHMIHLPGTLWLVAALIPEGADGEPVAVSAFPETTFENLNVRVTEISNRAYREFIQGIAGHVPDGKPCEVPIWHAARLFFELLDFSGKMDSPTAPAREAKRILQPYHDPGKLPYAYELMPLVDHPEQEIRQVDAEALLQNVDITWLTFPRDGLMPYWQRLEDLDHSLLVIPPEVRAERHRNIVHQAADELCSGKLRDLCRRFFEERALWLKLLGRESDAHAAWIVAQHLRGDFKASENPVVIELVVSSLHHHWPEESIASDEKDVASDPYYQTDSGLILPR